MRGRGEEEGELHTQQGSESELTAPELLRLNSLGSPELFGAKEQRQTQQAG